MLHTTVRPDFPFTGSRARTADGQVWTIVQSLPRGEVLLSRADTAGARGTRREAIRDLADPARDDLDCAGLDDRGRRQLVWLRQVLADRNVIVFASLKAELQRAAHEGAVPRCDGTTLAALLRRLGWHKQGCIIPGTLTAWRRAAETGEKALAA